MKIDRLMAILTILLQQDKVTAPVLSEKLEVSRRTISRDLEALCQAGIPIVTEQGFGGGISLAPGFKMDNSFLTAKEREALLAGIRGMDSVMKNPMEERLKEKFHIVQGNMPAAAEAVTINLASHYRDSLSEKIAVLKAAIHERRLVEFTYYYRKGTGRRLVEPYRVAFQWSSWYLLGYCRQREDFRMFKLNRLWELAGKEEAFAPREVPEEKLDSEYWFSDEIMLRARFSGKVKFRLIEEYGPSSFTEQEDGTLLVENLGFTNYPVLLEWVLSFGSSVEVLAPERLREDIKREAARILQNYCNVEDNRAVTEYPGKPEGTGTEKAKPEKTESEETILTSGNVCDKLEP